MSKLLRKAILAASTAAFGLTAAPALAQTTPNQNASATARILRPLTLSWVSDFDLGTIVLSGTGSSTVSVSQLGVRTCPASVTCSGTVSAATYNVRGSNGQVVQISAPNVTLNSGSNSLLLTVNAPASVTLTSSGAPGNNFSIGGSITVNENTPDGVYIGNFNVTASYQ